MSKEEMVRIVCEQFLYEHAELRKFTAGFKLPEACDCPACEAARELLRKEG